MAASEAERNQREHVSGKLGAAMLKSTVRRALHSLGYDLVRYVPAHSEAARFASMLSAHGVNLIFDVGANTGQFGRALRDLGYGGRIVSFEPLRDAWNRLQIAAQKDPLWEVAPRAAIGSEDGEIEIHVSGNSVSSSALKMLDSHLRFAPESAYIAAEQAPLRRLDSIAAGYLHADSIPFLKIDTQGFERQVLQGARELLKRTVGLQLELTFVPLYEGQAMYDELIADVRSRGFEMWDFITAHPLNTRILWGDGVFFRN